MMRNTLISPGSIQETDTESLCRLSPPVRMFVGRADSSCRYTQDYQREFETIFETEESQFLLNYTLEDLEDKHSLVFTGYSPDEPNDLLFGAVVNASGITQQIAGVIVPKNHRRKRLAIFGIAHMCTWIERKLNCTDVIADVRQFANGTTNEKSARSFIANGFSCERKVDRLVTASHQVAHLKKTMNVDGQFSAIRYRSSPDTLALSKHIVEQHVQHWRGDQNGE